VKLHVVKEGETLWGIAQKYGVSLDELIKANPQIQNPDVIHPGMKVKIPASAEPKPELIHQHKVKQGDTLWKLAKAWGIPLSTLIKANPHLKNPNALLTGEIVNIPKVPGQTAPSGLPPGSAGAGASGKADMPAQPAEQGPAKTAEQTAPPSAAEPPAAPGMQLAVELEKFTDLFKAVPIPPVEASAEPKAPPAPSGAPADQPAQSPTLGGGQTGLGAWPYGYAPDMFLGMQPAAGIGAPGWAGGKPDCGCGGSGGSGTAGQPYAHAAEAFPGLGAGWPVSPDAMYAQAGGSHCVLYPAGDPWLSPMAPVQPIWPPSATPYLPPAPQPYHPAQPYYPPLPLHAGTAGIPPATDCPPMPGYPYHQGYPPMTGYPYPFYPPAGTGESAGGRPDGTDAGNPEGSTDRGSGPQNKASKAKTASKENQERKKKEKPKTADAFSSAAARRNRSMPWTAR